MVDNSTVACVFGIGAVLFLAQFFMNQEPRRAARRVVSESQIDEVAAVVPQASREIIRADLEQTHSAPLSISRLLDANTRGQLARQPQGASSGRTGASSGSSGRTGASGSAPGSSLLNKYKLTGAEDVPETSSGWKGSRAERESQLKAQREAMILRARQKMQTAST